MVVVQGNVVELIVFSVVMVVFFLGSSSVVVSVFIIMFVVEPQPSFHF